MLWAIGTCAEFNDPGPLINSHCEQCLVIRNFLLQRVIRERATLLFVSRANESRTCLRLYNYTISRPLRFIALFLIWPASLHYLFLFRFLPSERSFFNVVACRHKLEKRQWPPRMRVEISIDFILNSDAKKMCNKVTTTLSPSSCLATGISGATVARASRGWVTSINRTGASRAGCSFSNNRHAFEIWSVDNDHISFHKRCN